jgi:hypothetical protein
MSLQHAIHKEISTAWVTLLLAGLFEIGFATSLKLMDSHRNIPWTIAFYVFTTPPKPRLFDQNFRAKYLRTP